MDQIAKINAMPVVMEFEALGGALVTVRKGALHPGGTEWFFWTCGGCGQGSTSLGDQYDIQAARAANRHASEWRCRPRPGTTATR